VDTCADFISNPGAMQARILRHHSAAGARKFPSLVEPTHRLGQFELP
jgi:hypothetical protein